MLPTPDQIRLRLEQARQTDHEGSCWQVLQLLEELLPEIVEALAHRAAAGRGELRGRNL